MFHRIGVNIWGAVVIIVFTAQLITLFDYYHFVRAIQYDPIVVHEVISRRVSADTLDYVKGRYILFLVARITAILIGGGIILRSNSCRLLGIFACLLMIILIGPRHMGFPSSPYNWFYWFRLKMFVHAIEIFLCSGFVYYFSRPAVVKLFKNR